MPVSTSIAFLTSAKVPVPSLMVCAKETSERERFSKRRHATSRCNSRLAKLVLFKDRTCTVQALSFASNTPEDVSRVVVVCLYGRSKRDLIPVSEYLFRDSFPVYLFKRSKPRLVYVLEVNDLSALAHVPLLLF